MPTARLAPLLAKLVLLVAAHSALGQQPAQGEAAITFWLGVPRDWGRQAQLFLLLIWCWVGQRRGAKASDSKQRGPRLLAAVAPGAARRPNQVSYVLVPGLMARCTEWTAVAAEGLHGGLQQPSSLHFAAVSAGTLGCS